MKKPTLKDIVYFIVIALLVAALTTVSVLYGVSVAKRKEETQTYYDRKVAAFALENANYAKGQIVFIGDSITDYYSLDVYYADLPLKTYDRGIGGDRTDGVYARLKGSLYDLAPAKIVMMIGINDINSGRSNEEILANYGAILSEIRANLPAAEVTCLSVLPMDARVEAWGIDLAKATAQIKDLNARIKPLAESKGYRFVDLFPLFAEQDDRLISAYSDDGLHPNAAGYAVWTAALKPYLNRGV